MLSDAFYTETVLSNSHRWVHCVSGNWWYEFWRDMPVDTFLSYHSPSFPWFSVALAWCHIFKKNRQVLKQQRSCYCHNIVRGTVLSTFPHLVLITSLRDRREITLCLSFRWGNRVMEVLISCLRSPHQYNSLMLGPSHHALAPGKALDNKQNSWTWTDHQAYYWEES